MRIFIAALVALLLVGAAGCGNERRPQSRDLTKTPTPGGEITLGQVIVNPDELPGCALDREGEIIVRRWSRSFNCAQGDRLTNAVQFYETLSQAELDQDTAWGTMDTARDQIRSTIFNRPTNVDSLRVTNAAENVAKLGADKEYVYCATYTDVSGTQRVTEYYGTFRYGNIVVYYTSWALSADGCSGASRARDNAQMLASKQFTKLKSALSPPTGAPSPTRAP